MKPGDGHALPMCDAAPDPKKRYKKRSRPQWLRVKLPGGADYARVRRTIRRLGLHTVCAEAACPNVAECWARRSMTVMILGARCTRRCRFCNVATKRPALPDPGEPARVAEALRELSVRHAVITSVSRDDLDDGGAAHWAETLRLVRSRCPEMTLEALSPDFQGDMLALDQLLEAAPHVFAHNLETVRRLTPSVRSHASYDRSLAVLRHAALSGAVVKSGLMAGLGETVDELRVALRDIRDAGALLVTVGQYLQPSRTHLEVVEYLDPAIFEELGSYARRLGFAHVASGPLVRSSYHADEGARALSSGGRACDDVRLSPHAGCE